VEHLNPVDAAFLDIEDGDRQASLAIGSVAVIAGPPPAQRDFVAAVGARARLIPRARQKVVRSPLNVGRPVWVDDPGHDPAEHIRRTSVDRDDPTALPALISRIMSRRLDRDRPLWEIWVIDGLPGDRWAVLTKIHHCLADGVSGAQLQAAIFGSAPWSGPAAGDPELAPGPGRSLVGAITDMATGSAVLVRRLAGALRSPEQLPRRLALSLRGVAAFGAVLRPVGSSSLSGPIGRQRRYGVAHAALPDLVEIGRVFGATVNDVLLAISGAFRELLLCRGERPDANTVRTLVPVSVRAAGDEGVPDNRISLVLPFLPVDMADPVEVLAEVHRRLAAAKASGMAEIGETVAALAAGQPFAPVSLAVRLFARLPQHSIVTVTTNVPGPGEPMSVLGREVLELLPYVPIAVRLRIGVAALSYCDQVAIGVTGDHDTVPEIALFAGAVERGVTDLLAAARSITPINGRRGHPARPFQPNGATHARQPR